MKKISIVAPVYNEEMNIKIFILELMDNISDLKNTYDFEILLVNDGSTDDTKSILHDMARQYRGLIRVVNFTRNFGHIAACSACLDFASGDAIIIMDSDLQDDPKAILEFISQWEKGYKIVYAVRTERQEGLVTRFLFKAFYRLFNLIGQISLPLDAGNYSLIDKDICEIVKASYEKNPYFPGVRAFCGFEQYGVPTPRRERPDGKSRVGYKGLFRLALTAIFSFSFLPIRIFNIFGMITMIVAMGLIMYALYSKLVSNIALPSWTSQIISISFFGGINLLGIGVVGEYVARIYDQVRKYPKYIVSDIYEDVQVDSQQGFS